MNERPEIPDGWERGSVEANGIELHYCRTGGRGPPFVVSHGFSDDGYCRLDLARELADDFDVVLYDARGHGRSDAPDESYGAPERAADLLGLLDALAIENPILFGHSMGADTVAAAAVRSPDRPRAVVLEDPVWMVEGRDAPGGGSEDEGRGEGLAEQIARWQDASVEQVFEDEAWLGELAESSESDLAHRIADARRRLRPEVTRVFEAGLLDHREVCGDIEAPTLVLKADAEEAVRERERAIADNLSDGRLVHVEDAGHTVFWDERERATEELRTFLATV
ncbi:alpha/beta hydrolase fold protein [Halosimplex carlsbadense 2-9-1]|uniref:Alpha/beta hydrolase fold protein n=1 Tax=Halosimplex carlsbadense 2-9-1 TaxID=797114 RepID=M0CUS2_9EURY|nr:alpha/beta hydrolase [Halosimplex carlsbadense]ELZ26975.1 alpha/beta hydrolase fold protein [Halosimplex carlsbadense 2-9-1]